MWWKLILFGIGLNLTAIMVNDFSNRKKGKTAEDGMGVAIIFFFAWIPYLIFLGITGSWLYGKITGSKDVH